MQKLTISTSDELPITADEVKQWCRIDTDLEDMLLDGMILAATEAAEAETNRSLRASQIEYRFPHSKRSYNIPTCPVRSVSKVEIESESGQRTVLSAGTDYLVTLSDRGATVSHLSFGGGAPWRVVITAAVGYADPEFIPQAIKQAISVHVGSAYNGREGQDTARATFKALLSPYRVELL